MLSRKFICISARLLAGLALLLLSGCGVLQAAGLAPSPVPTIHRPPTPTRPMPPTSTATPVIPTATPEIPLAMQGPWLTYLSSAKSGSEMVAANRDGSGPKTVGIIPNLDLPDLARPQTGAARYFSLLNGRDATLMVFELPGGKVRKSFSLLSSPDLTNEQRQIYGTLLNSAEIPAQVWSPDGRRLAFTGAMDGAFTDVYVYEPQSDQLTRLTAALGESFTPAWAPDGESVLVQEYTRQAAGTVLVDAVFQLPVDGSANAPLALYRPKSLGEQIFGWLDGQNFLVASRRAAGLVELRRYNLEKREHALLDFSGPFAGGVFAPGKGVLAFLTAAPDKNVASLQQGLYWTSAATSAVPVLRGKWSRLEWSPAAGRFFAASPGLVLSFAPNEEKVRFEGEDNLPVISLDGKLLAFASGEGLAKNGLRLYAPDGKRQREITTEPVSEVLWQPDGSGLLYISNGVLYAVSLPEGAPLRIREGVSNIGWVAVR